MTPPQVTDETSVAAADTTTEVDGTSGGKVHKVSTCIILHVNVLRVDVPSVSIAHNSSRRAGYVAAVTRCALVVIRE